MSDDQIAESDRLCIHCGEALDERGFHPSSYRPAAQNADTVRYSMPLPMGYFQSAPGDLLPWFDREGRVIVLLCHADGSVTWQLIGKDDEVLEPRLIDGDVSG